MNKTLALLYFVVSFSTLAQEVKIPNDFIEIPVPKSYSKDWYFLNYSNESYSIKKDGGKLIIETKEKGSRTYFEVEGGKLIGVNEGEWGGALYFRTENLKEKIVVIKPGNIVDIFKFKNKIYFIDGLAHMTMSYGGLYELLKTDNVFSYRKISDFDDAPHAITSFNNKFFIISYKNFYIVDLEDNNKITKIFDNQFWDGLYPNSIEVFDEKNIFVGMRGGILKLNIVEGIITFYKKNK